MFIIKLIDWEKKDVLNVKSKSFETKLNWNISFYQAWQNDFMLYVWELAVP